MSDSVVHYSVILASYFISVASSHPSFPWLPVRYLIIYVKLLLFVGIFSSKGFILLYRGSMSFVPGKLCVDITAV